LPSSSIPLPAVSNGLVQMFGEVGMRDLDPGVDDPDEHRVAAEPARRPRGARGAAERARGAGGRAGETPQIAIQVVRIIRGRVRPDDVVGLGEHDGRVPPQLLDRVLHRLAGRGEKELCETAA
jgi:hypothetical protein